MPFSYLMKFLCLQTSPIFMKKVPKSLFASTFKGFKMKIPLAINFSEQRRLFRASRMSLLTSN